jgi:hypothetical protein
MGTILVSSHVSRISQWQSVGIENLWSDLLDLIHIMFL